MPKVTPTLTHEQQVSLYWKIQRAWQDRRAAKEPMITFEQACKCLRAIIEAPAASGIGASAKKLLNDIVLNAVAPEVPEEAHKKTS